ncbi:hypothetical protein HY630_03810 [Candidatus Uhrbacteria bacterium]|nr:hypothetical protein [Candidatus Uhrbacteria bacterium]
MALKRIEIPGVRPMEQGDSELLVFVLSAPLLLEIGVTLRFGEHPLGVNRELTPNRAKEMLRYMKTAKRPIMRDPILGCLYPGDGVEWSYDRKRGILTAEVETDPDKRTEGCFFVVDDGQHRLATLEMLSGDDRKRWSFTVIAGMGLEVDDRIALFMQGEKRVRVSNRLLLAQMDATNTFPNDTTGNAYRVAKRLNEATASPLRGKIYFGQSPKVPKGTFPVTSLMGQLKYAMGKRSRLNPYPSEQQKEMVLNLFIAAAQQWPGQWGKLDKTLGRPLGYLTLITLIARSGNLYALLNGNFNLDSFRRAMEHAKGFRWDQPGTRDGSITYNKLMLSLDEHLGQSIAAAESARAS